MSRIMATAPTCLANPALFGHAGKPGFEYIALGQPSFDRLSPQTTSFDWAKLAEGGKAVALDITPGVGTLERTYLEVRAFRGSYYKLFDRDLGEKTVWSAGTFLFPARKPLILGAFKCFRILEVEGGESFSLKKNVMRTASVGKRGTIVAYDSDYDQSGVRNNARNVFLACLSLTYYTQGGHDLSKALRSIRGIIQRGNTPATILMQQVFSTSTPDGPSPKLEAFDPETSTDFDPVLPLRDTDALTPGSRLIGYDLKRSRFVDLDV